MKYVVRIKFYPTLRFLCVLYYDPKGFEIISITHIHSYFYSIEYFINAPFNIMLTNTIPHPPTQTHTHVILLHIFSNKEIK